ncbi:hypothetical protein AB1N83_014012 [Pleurotus pulmonarius]
MTGQTSRVAIGYDRKRALTHGALWVARFASRVSVVRAAFSQAYVHDGTLRSRRRRRYSTQAQSHSGCVRSASTRESLCINSNDGYESFKERRRRCWRSISIHHGSETPRPSTSHIDDGAVVRAYGVRRICGRR